MRSFTYVRGGWRPARCASHAADPHDARPTGRIVNGGLMRQVLMRGVDSACGPTRLRASAPGRMGRGLGVGYEIMFGGPDGRAGNVRRSSRERRILADVENDLAASDPHLAKELGRRSPLPTPGVWPLSVRCMVLLLLVLVVTSVLVPASRWPVLGVITTVVVVPWILLCVSEQREPDWSLPRSPKRRK